MRAAIFGGALFNSFARGKHGKANCPISSEGGTPREFSMFSLANWGARVARVVLRL
jgi:hypothetical protein